MKVDAGTNLLFFSSYLCHQCSAISQYVLVWRLFSFQHFSAASSDILHVIEAGLEDWFM